MPRIRPDQLAEAFRQEGAATLPVSRVCDAIARTGGPFDPASAGEEVRRSARSRPDLFFLLEPAAWWSALEAAPGDAPRAPGAAPAAPEARVVLLAGEGAGAPVPPRVRHVVLSLWDGAPADAAARAELASAMHDAVALDDLLGSDGPPA